MKVTKLVFSPTGGTQKVTDIVANAMHCESESIDLCRPGFNADDIVISGDVCIIAVPVISGRAPISAIERISALKGDGRKAVLISVYGNRAFEDALVELQDTAEKAGFVPVAGIAAIAEHSILRKFAANRPDAADTDELTGFAAKIAEVLENPAKKLSMPGNRPYKEFKGSAVKPVTNDNCVKCGLCAANCPVSAISAENPRETDLNKCASCMRCIDGCPVKARTLPESVSANVDALLSKVAIQRRNNELFI